MTVVHPGRPVELPVRRLEIVERDGERARALHVFCPGRQSSVDATVCATCAFAHTTSETSVICTPHGPPEPVHLDRDPLLFLGPDALALRTPVGTVSALHTMAVRVDAPMAQARKLLQENAIVVVLTPENLVHGVLSSYDDSKGLRALSATGERAHLLPESAPLIEAVELMVHGHVRLVTLTGGEGRFVGVVADLDVLRWVARSRQAAH